MNNMHKMIVSLALGCSLMAAASSTQASLVAMWDFNGGSLTDSVGGVQLTIQTGYPVDSAATRVENGQLIIARREAVYTTDSSVLLSGDFTLWLTMSSSSIATNNIFFGYGTSTVGTDNLMPSFNDIGYAAYFTGADTAPINAQYKGDLATVTVGETASVSENETFALALVYDSSTGELSIVLNGVEVSATTNVANTLDSLTMFAVGFLRFDAASIYDNMTVDEIRIYDSALSAAEIAAIPESSSMAALLAVLAMGAVLAARRRLKK
ncbi:MAG: LamG-like jellyroll fold domain-containing protein [Verrucomicrobiota bacterium JB024]|nr:LamG-like jellyroll fold domain-containing protein [Verrucomicrobiota bacterium JB024]